MTRPDRPSYSLWKRQAAACATFGLLLASIIGTLYVQHRQREWVLRQEQAQHRLDIVFELISREVKRVRADAMYLANRNAVRRFVAGDSSRADELTHDFIQFVQEKELYDQIRLLDLSGRETLRVNLAGDSAQAVDQHALQDKADRYYFQEALSLRRGELFVSEFDLNLEHGRIERPLKPVIRFVAPVYDESEAVAAFIVLNYLGAELLHEVDDSTIPGDTLLLRRDGHYICGPTQDDQWGWLLGHERTFATQFPHEWSQMDRLPHGLLTPHGAFAAKTIPLGRLTDHSSDHPAAHGTAAAASNAGNAVQTNGLPREQREANSITVVSYLPQRSVFAASNELLERLLIFAGGVFALAIVFTRAWARATLARQQQAERIAASEERLRELSSRLLRIQEDERRAISREIHDELGQQATAISLDLKLAQRNVESQKAMPHLQRAISENETLLRTLHEFAKRVRPAVLDDLGLKEAIESHVMEFATRTGVHIETRLEFPPPKISDEIADHSFRLVQESLNNVAKHADASKVTVTMAIVGDREDELLIAIKDDGCGHAEVDSGDGLGLIGMQERVDLLSGVLEIQSSQDRGTSVTIRLPLGSHRQGEVACP